MKLMFCPDCWDVKKFGDEKTSCKCGASWAYYEIDGYHGVYGGKCIPLGIDNTTLLTAIRQDKFNREVLDQDDPKSLGVRFEAFIIPECAPSIKKIAE